MIFIDTSEVEALADDLDRAGPIAIERTRDVVEKTGNDTVADSKAACPIDTGFLRASIGMDLDPDGLGFEAGPTASYGGYVHFGTSRMGPRPYLLPYFDRRTTMAIPAFEEIVARFWPTAG